MDGSTMPGRRNVGSWLIGLLMFWKWTLPARKQKDPKAKAKPATWWSFWRWRFWSAKPLTLKRSPIPSLGGLVKLDPRSWDILQGVANVLAAFAVGANLALVCVYAAVVASQSVLPLIANWDFSPHAFHHVWYIGAFFKWTIIAVFVVVATVSAGALQFGTDFLWPFASGLAESKYRVVPTSCILLWMVCAVITVSMKVDVYTGWGRERIAEAAATTTTNDSDQRILDKYPVPPPTLAQSDAAKNAAQRDLNRLQPEYERQIKARDSEETNRDNAGNGMGPKWRGIDTEVKRLGGEIAAANATLSKADADHANRLEYDVADRNVKGSAKTVSVSRQQLLYDAPLIVWLRSIGMAAFSFVMVLVQFMVRAARAEKAKRSQAAYQGVDTKNEKANTREGEFEEHAPINAPKLGSQPITGPAVVGQVDTKTLAPRPHPDAAGDDVVNGVNGYVPENGAPDGTAERDQSDA